MKKIGTALLTFVLAFGAVACGNQEDDSTTTEATTTTANESSTTTETSKKDSNSKTLIVYFTLPEDVDPDGADAVSGASIVVRNGKSIGSNEFVAETIQKAIGGDLVKLETKQEYPKDHQPLIDQAQEEQENGDKPAIKTKIDNLDQYDTVIVGYPNWWGDMPQPLYTFFDEYDFSGKTIIPFVTHGGSGMSSTLDEIKELEPKATVSDDALILSRDDVAESEDEITSWANNLK